MIIFDCKWFFVLLKLPFVFHRQIAYAPTSEVIVTFPVFVTLFLPFTLTSTWLFSTAPRKVNEEQAHVAMASVARCFYMWMSYIWYLGFSLTTESASSQLLANWRSMWHAVRCRLCLVGFTLSAWNTHKMRSIPTKFVKFQLNSSDWIMANCGKIRKMSAKFARSYQNT